MAMTGLSLKATVGVTAGPLQSGDKRPYRSTAQKRQVSQLACVSASHEVLRAASVRHLTLQRPFSSTAVHYFGLLNSLSNFCDLCEVR